MALSLNQVQSLQSLQRSYKWDLEIIGLPVISVADAANQINLRCISATVPVPKIDPVSTNPRGIDLTEPGIVHLNGEIQFVIVETVDLISRKILRELQNINMDDETKAQSDFSGPNSKAFDVRMLRLDNWNNPTWEYLCKKCWLSNFDDAAFDSQSNAVNVQFTIHYNWFTSRALI